jgi:hypothetical protein
MTTALRAANVGYVQMYALALEAMEEMLFHQVSKTTPWIDLLAIEKTSKWPEFSDFGLVHWQGGHMQP